MEFQWIIRKHGGLKKEHMKILHVDFLHCEKNIHQDWLEVLMLLDCTTRSGWLISCYI